MLECLESYDPYKGAEFLTYAHHAIGNTLIQCRMMEESGSFASLDEYKRVRGIAWLYNETGKSKGEVVSEYAKKVGGVGYDGKQDICGAGSEVYPVL